MAHPKLETTMFTRVSFIKILNTHDPRDREDAWSEFRQRYGPIIMGFARNLGADPDLAEEIAQEVTVGFLQESPTFVYDPSIGRFRGYLKTCAGNAMKRHWRKFRRHADVEAVDPAALATDHVWEDIWEQELLRQAMNRIKEKFSKGHTYDIFVEYVIAGRPVTDVAAQFGVSEDVVYQAKVRMQKSLRAEKTHMSDDYG